MVLSAACRRNSITYALGEEECGRDASVPFRRPTCICTDYLRVCCEIPTDN